MYTTPYKHYRSPSIRILHNTFPKSSANAEKAGWGGRARINMNYEPSLFSNMNKGRSCHGFAYHKRNNLKMFLTESLNSSITH